LEVPEAPPLTIRILSVNNRDLEAMVRKVQAAAEKSNSGIDYVEEKLFRIRPSEAKKYNFPPQYFGQMAFLAVLRINNPLAETFEGLAQIRPSSLVRISIE
jgi:hypothetical protein